MFAFRRAAARAFASPSLSSSIRSSQSIRTYSLALHKNSLASQSLPSSLSWQRRWASDEAETRQEPAADGEIQHHDPIPTERGVGAEHSSASEQLQSDPDAQRTVGQESGSGIREAIGQAAQKTREAVENSGAPESVQNAAATVTGAVANAAGAGRSGQGNTVFVGNLFYHVNEKQLETELSKYGTVADTKIARDPRGLSKGFGFVTFNTPAEAARAIEEGHNSMFEGRLLSLAASNRQTRAGRPTADALKTPKKTNPPTRTLWIGNMSYDMTDTDLNNLFRPLKNVLDVRVAIDRRTGQARGFAHADFMDTASATEAMEQLENQVIYGRKLRLDYGVTYADKDKVQQKGSAPADVAHTE